MVTFNQTYSFFYAGCTNYKHLAVYNSKINDTLLYLFFQTNKNPPPYTSPFTLPLHLLKTCTTCIQLFLFSFIISWD